MSYLIVPVHVKMKDAEKFACDKVEWIRKQIVNKIEKVLVKHGTVLPIGGVPHTIIAGGGKKIILKEGTIIAPLKEKSFNLRLKAFLIELARQRFCERTDYYTKLIEKKYISWPRNKDWQNNPFGYKHGWLPIHNINNTMQTHKCTIINSDLAAASYV